MNVYRDGTTVKLTIPLTTDSGELIPSLVSVAYRVVDHNNVEVVPHTAVADFTPGDSSVTLTIAGANNAVGTARRVLRIVEVATTDDAGTVLYLNSVYAVETAELLTKGVNSYQSYGAALITALDMPALDAWEAANERSRTQAMIEAYHRLGKLVYRIPYRLISGDIVSLNNWTQTEFDKLPEPFLTALRRAQLCEANIILEGNAGDSVQKLREEGLMSKTVGESSMMFRPGQPLKLLVDRKTLDILSGFVSFSLVIGRR